LRKAVAKYRTTCPLSVVFLTIISSPSSADLTLGPEELVQANSTVISVPGYSVPSFVDWNGDGLKDLIVGEGPGTSSQGKVRVYLNVGSASAPTFGSYFFAQAGGVDLVVPGAG
jgi:hypothetical protein